MKHAWLAIPFASLVACAAPPRSAAEKPEPAPAPVVAPAGAKSKPESEKVYTVVALQHADADQLSRVLMAAVQRRSNQQIVSDSRTNSLIVTCDPDELPALLKLIAALDIPVKPS
ncbi:MAG: hypothetical protein JNL28_09605 [Planctomycetes bacterium]|nr:hypothetical protein [Planctomycetota bacterium]